MTTDHTALKEAAEAATSGEWKTFDFHRVETARRHEVSGAPVDICAVEEGVDAKFIALANPSKILELLAENEALEERERVLETSRDKWMGMAGDLRNENASLREQLREMREKIQNTKDDADGWQISRAAGNPETEQIYAQRMLDAINEAARALTEKQDG